MAWRGTSPVPTLLYRVYLKVLHKAISNENRNYICRTFNLFIQKFNSEYSRYVGKILINID